MTSSPVAGAASDRATGVVLAGGLSRRMGQSKAALRIGGQPLLQRIADRLLLVIPKVLVVGPPELSRLVPGLLVQSDLHPGAGPLSGIETALRMIPTELTFVVACDMPFVNPRLVSAMLKYAEDHPRADVVALAHDSTLEPLHAVYRRSCLPQVSRHLELGNYALLQLLSDLCTQKFPWYLAQELDPDHLSALNANSPAEWERALVLAAAGTPPS